MKNQPGTMKNDEKPWKTNLEAWKTMKTDLEVEVELDLRPLGKVIIFRDKQTNRQLLLYIDLWSGQADGQSVGQSEIVRNS